MNPQKPQCFVIVVHHGSPHPTRQAITSWLHGHTLPTKIVVIDHGLTPLVLSPSSLVTLIRPANNAGYAGGVNMALGILVAEQPRENALVIVANNDVEVEPTTLTQLVQWWAQHPEPAVVGVRSREDERVVAGAGRLNYLTGRAHLNIQLSQRLDYIHGAFFSLPYRTLLHLQGLPEQYFMYWEDVLFSRRARQRQVALVVAPTVWVKHAGDKQVMSPQRLYYLVRNGAHYLAHETPPLVRWWWRLLNPWRELYHRARPRTTTTRVLVQALRDARRGRLGQRSL